MTGTHDRQTRELLAQIMRELKNTMYRRNMQQKELCCHTGMSPSKLSQLLNGRRKLTMTGYLNICCALGLDPAEGIRRAVRHMEDKEV